MSTIGWLASGFFKRVEKNICIIVEIFRAKGVGPSLIYTVKLASTMLDYYFNLKKRQFDFPIISIFFDQKRRKTQAIAAKHTKHLDETLERVGNYACDKDLNSRSIVYSFGIARDISFERELIRSKGCNVYAYDPTPSAKEFILNEIKHPNIGGKLSFKQEALWIEDGTSKFYSATNSTDQGSLTNLWSSDSFYEVTCHKLETFMQENGHDSIDLLKMDIEGAAIKVMRSWIDSGAYIPNSIACEIEHPKHDDLWLEEVSSLLSDFEKLNFEIFYLSRRVQFNGLDLYLRRAC